MRLEFEFNTRLKTALSEIVSRYKGQPCTEKLKDTLKKELADYYKYIFSEYADFDIQDSGNGHITVTRIVKNPLISDYLEKNK